MSIGHFAEATGLSVSAVRFYANRGVLHPADVDARSGYRRFAAHQVADGQLIRDLRRLQMPLPLIARALGLTESERRNVVQSHLDQLAANVGRVHSIAQDLGAATDKDTAVDTNDPNTNDLNTNDAQAVGALTLPARALGAAVGQVLPVACVDPILPHLMTVLLEAKDGSLRVVATDRHRLAVRDLVPTAFTRAFTVVVAAAAVGDWQPLLDVDGDVTIEATTTTITLSGAVETSADRIPAEYPDYQTVLDTPTGVTTVIADPSAIDEVLIDRSSPTTFEFGSAGLRVRHGADAAEVRTSHTGPNQSVLLNPTFLRTALAAMIGNEVVIDIVDPLRPLVIRSADDGTFTTLVMPIAPE